MKISKVDIYQAGNADPLEANFVPTADIRVLTQIGQHIVLWQIDNSCKKEYLPNDKMMCVYDDQ